MLPADIDGSLADGMPCPDVASRRLRTKAQKGPSLVGIALALLASRRGQQTPREPAQPARQRLAFVDVHDPARRVPRDIILLVVPRRRCWVAWIVLCG